MSKRRDASPPELQQRIVEWVRSGRSLNALAREFEPSVESIRNLVRQADLADGRRGDGLPTTEREELHRLKRDICRLRAERDIRGS